MSLKDIGRAAFPRSHSCRPPCVHRVTSDELRRLAQDNDERLQKATTLALYWVDAPAVLPGAVLMSDPSVHWGAGACVYFEDGHCEFVLNENNALGKLLATECRSE